VVDLGAASGRVMLASACADAVRLTEHHRFANTPVDWPTGRYWDLPDLYAQVATGIGAAIAAAVRAHGRPPATLGIATWGVDFGLVDQHGQLLGLPGHYRDGRPDLVDRLDQDEAYQITGVAPQSINTASRLLDERWADALAAADELLLMPALLGYLLTGRRGMAEYTIASTTQLTDPATRRWAPALLDRLGLGGLVAPVHEPGRVVGSLRPQVVPDQPAAGDVSLVTVAGHDTASAMVATPATGADFAFISCGTWALVGLELPTPIRTLVARDAGFTNEGGLDGTTRFLRNVTGLWLLDESVRTWRRQGRHVDAADALAAAADAPPGAALIDPADPGFLPPGDMPARIADYCRRTGQAAPDSIGALTRCVLESLAAAFCVTIEQAASIAGRRVEVIHLVGGGSRATLLCQLTADLSGRPVVAGPVEATALGNALVQARAAGELGGSDGSLAGLRERAARSASTTTYQPRRRADRAIVRRFGEISASAAAPR